MKPRLPSMETLQAFDAAMRLGSFSRAADEVHLTHGAVSRRIGELERVLKLALFDRLAQGVRPTAAGHRFHANVVATLAGLSDGIAELRRNPERRRPVRLSVLPSFASRWLLPRLAAFRARHADIEIQLLADQAMADFARDRVDLAIRYGLGRWPRLTIEPLMSETLCPVAAVRPRGRLIRRAGDLDGQTILQDQNEDAWNAWLDSVGWSPPRARSETYDDYNLALEAAANGLGIAIGRSRLTEIELGNGRLRRVSEFQAPNPKAYYLVTPKRTATEEALTFMAWLRRVAQERRSPASPR
jgi:LysR family glycine cleavage system transcriptional activator